MIPEVSRNCGIRNKFFPSFTATAAKVEAQSGR